MTNKQKYALVFGLFAIFMMVLIPPWQSSGYGLIFDPPAGADEIDFKRLLVQVAMAAILSGALFLVSKSDKPTEASDEESKPENAFSKPAIYVFSVFLIATCAVLGVHFYGKHQAEVQAQELLRQQAEAARLVQEKLAADEAAAQQAQEQARLQAAENERANAEAWIARLQVAAKPRQWRVTRGPQGVQTTLQTYWKDDNIFYRLQLKGSPDALEAATAGDKIYAIRLDNKDGISIGNLSVRASELRNYRDRGGTISIMASDNATASSSLDSYVLAKT